MRTATAIGACAAAACLLGPARVRAQGDAWSVSERDYLEKAVTVTRVRRDCPLPEYDDRLPVEPADPERLIELSDRWGLTSSVNRVLNAFAKAHAAV